MKLLVPEIKRIDRKTLRVTLLLGDHTFVSDIVENESGDAYNFQSAEANIIVTCCGFLRAFNSDYLLYQMGRPHPLPWDYGEIPEWRVEKAMERIAKEHARLERIEKRKAELSRPSDESVSQFPDVDS